MYNESQYQREHIGEEFFFWLKFHKHKTMFLYGKKEQRQQQARA